MAGGWAGPPLSGPSVIPIQTTALAFTGLVPSTPPPFGGGLRGGGGLIEAPANPSRPTPLPGPQEKKRIYPQRPNSDADLRRTNPDPLTPPPPPGRASATLSTSLPLRNNVRSPTDAEAAGSSGTAMHFRPKQKRRAQGWPSGILCLRLCRPRALGRGQPPSTCSSSGTPSTFSSAGVSHADTLSGTGVGRP